MHPADEVVSALVVPGEPELAGRLVLVGPPRGDLAPASLEAAVERLATLPCVVVGVPGWVPPEAAAAMLDTWLDRPDEVEAVVAAVARCPSTASALALHLRGAPRRDPLDGLVAESALYSTLQAGAEHAGWRAATPVRARSDAVRARVRVERDGHQLTVTLTRPDRHNALDVAMRDQLLDALAVAEADPSLKLVLRGEGPSFCSGGDLDEFGTAPSPPEAHEIRLRRSIGAVLHRLSGRTTVAVHGRCVGSGVELPAFAGRLVSGPDATFELPELSMGLIPGAGGTVSLPRRIGRHRTAWMAFTGRRIDARTAHSWGLVDEIDLT